MPRFIWLERLPKRFASPAAVYAWPEATALMTVRADCSCAVSTPLSWEAKRASGSTSWQRKFTNCCTDSVQPLVSPWRLL